MAAPTPENITMIDEKVSTIVGDIGAVRKMYTLCSRDFQSVCEKARSERKRILATCLLLALLVTLIVQCFIRGVS